MEKECYRLKKGILDLLTGVLNKAKAVQLLGKTKRTVNRYIQRYLDQGF